MFTASNVFSILRRFLLRLFARKRGTPARRRVTDTQTTAEGFAAAATVVTGTPERSKATSRAALHTGFDMPTEIAKLAHRIVEPVAAKLAMQELEAVVGRICRAFEQLNPKRTVADTDLHSMAVDIMEPVQPMLNEAEFTRMVDRLKGAMAAFCQKSDWSQSAA